VSWGKYDDPTTICTNILVAVSGVVNTAEDGGGAGLLGGLCFRSSTRFIPRARATQRI